MEIHFNDIEILLTTNILGPKDLNVQAQSKIYVLKTYLKDLQSNVPTGT